MSHSKNHLLTFYNKFPITFARGDGVWLYDGVGKAYLDALSGVGVCALGHRHPAITKAITSQADTLMHVANTFYTQPLLDLAKRLCEITGLYRAYFSNSGAESAEAIIKMALKFGTNKGIKNPKIIVMEGGFHGRSLGAWSGSCDQSKSQFGPLIPAFTRVPFNDLAAAQAAVTPDTVAIMLEPVLGKGGLLPADIAYMEALRQLCDQKDLLLILDEVQSGMGRTGKWFAYQYSNIQPDILATAKALGNGMPIGAFITNEKAAPLLQPSDHGSTQGGNALACHVALAVINTIEKEKLMDQAVEVGDYLQTQLHRALQTHPLYDGIQGKGLMIGIRLTRPEKSLLKLGVEQGLIMNFASKQVLRLLPPLILTRQEADVIVEKLSLVFQGLLVE